MSKTPGDARAMVLIAIVTDGRHDMSVKTLTSILGLQLLLMTTEGPMFSADVKFVRDLNDAVDLLHRDSAYRGAMIVHSNAGFQPEFATKAFASGEGIVMGVSPIPIVDWGRVARRPPGDPEQIEYCGNLYNVKLAGTPRADGYAIVAGLKATSVMYLSREVVDAVAREHPEIVGDVKSAFVVDAVVDGKTVPGIGRFITWYGKPIVADTEHQVVVCGPMDFCGIVGERAYVR